jgi:hypothetical protein
MMVAAWPRTALSDSEAPRACFRCPLRGSGPPQRKTGQRSDRPVPRGALWSLSRPGASASLCRIRAAQESSEISLSPQPSSSSGTMRSLCAAPAGKFRLRGCACNWPRCVGFTCNLVPVAIIRWRPECASAVQPGRMSLLATRLIGSVLAIEARRGEIGPIPFAAVAR